MKKLLLIGMIVVAAVQPAFCIAASHDEWDHLSKMIRDGKIGKAEAKKQIMLLNAILLRDFAGIPKGERPHFPVKGYGPASIGGINGSGFRPKEYDFYDGNKHGGHPAHDIFVKDENQDSLDDGIGKPVEVVAYTGGVVVSTNTEW